MLDLRLPTGLPLPLALLGPAQAALGLPECMGLRDSYEPASSAALAAGEPSNPMSTRMGASFMSGVDTACGGDRPAQRHPESEQADDAAGDAAGDADGQRDAHPRASVRRGVAEVEREHLPQPRERGDAEGRGDQPTRSPQPGRIGEHDTRLAAAPATSETLISPST